MTPDQQNLMLRIYAAANAALESNEAFMELCGQLPGAGFLPEVSIQLSLERKPSHQAESSSASSDAAFLRSLGIAPDLEEEPAPQHEQKTPEPLPPESNATFVDWDYWREFFGMKKES